MRGRGSDCFAGPRPLWHERLASVMALNTAAGSVPSLVAASALTASTDNGGKEIPQAARILVMVLSLDEFDRWVVDASSSDSKFSKASCFHPSSCKLGREPLTYGLLGMASPLGGVTASALGCDLAPAPRRGDSVTLLLTPGSRCMPTPAGRPNSQLGVHEVEAALIESTGSSYCLLHLGNRRGRSTGGGLRFINGRA
eukprot:6492257-Amphidinium_carterae.1